MKINQFAIHYLVDNGIDLSGFEARFKNDEEGRPGYDLRILLKGVLTGYSRGIVHSRKLERACGKNVTFMALACGQTPDHSTIAFFVSSMQDLILAVFRGILLVCEKKGLLNANNRWIKLADHLPWDEFARITLHPCQQTMADQVNSS